MDIRAERLKMLVSGKVDQLQNAIEKDQVKLMSSVIAMLLSDCNIKPTANPEKKDRDPAFMTAIKAKMNRIT